MDKEIKTTIQMNDGICDITQTTTENYLGKFITTHKIHKYGNTTYVSAFFDINGILSKTGGSGTANYKLELKTHLKDHQEFIEHVIRELNV